MASSSNLVSTAAEHGGLDRHRYFERPREMVDAFVARHFTWPGTLHLHGAALGWDILRAPLNVLLSPVLMLSRFSACLCRRVGWRGGADWLAARRILLRTSVARRVEGLIVTDLLEMPLDHAAAARDPSALARAALVAPQFREMIRTRSDPFQAEALGQRVASALAEYAGTRSAVAEMTTTLCILLVGAVVFQALTPGMISMAPDVAGAVARHTAIAAFPLGHTIGGLWYGMFGVGASPWLMSATIAGLLMIGSVVAAFAGVLADPVQVRLGIHRRRLHRLLDTLERELVGRGDKPFVAREHFFARVLDFWDSVVSAVRMFRN